MIYSELLSHFNGMVRARSCRAPLFCIDLIMTRLRTAKMESVISERKSRRKSESRSCDLRREPSLFGTIFYQTLFRSRRTCVRHRKQRQHNIYDRNASCRDSVSHPPFCSLVPKASEFGSFRNPVSHATNRRKPPSSTPCSIRQQTHARQASKANGTMHWEGGICVH